MGGWIYWCLRSQCVKTPVIMELKVSETYKGMENACDTTMQQIEEKKV